MPDDHFDSFGSADRHDDPSDPLGIIGWAIGGKYKIRSYIGGGGFGEVYEGYNLNLQRQRVVIKFFKRIQSRDKFAKEAKILCLLDHPNILRVIDYLQDEGALVVPFIDGKDGNKVLSDSGPLREDLFLKVASTMTDSLAYAHEMRVAHRDLKPGNILIDKRDHAYLIDFGIAKEMGGTATKTSYIALTPQFAAPERQNGDRDYDPFLSDIFEMGITLFNFATNEMPYRNPRSPNINEWGGGIAKKLAPQLIRILKKATQPNPEDRYQSAAQLASDIKNLKKAYREKSKWYYAGVGLAAIFLIVVGFMVRQFFPNNDSNSSYTATTTSNKDSSDSPVGANLQDSTPVTAARGKELRTPSERENYKAVENPQHANKLTALDTVPIPSENAQGPATSRATGNKEKIMAADANLNSANFKEKPDVNAPMIDSKNAKAKVSEIQSADKISGASNNSDSVVVTSQPPPISTAKLFISVLPRAENALLFVDNQQKDFGKEFDVEVGEHEIKIIHPDYPILYDTLNVLSLGGSREYDLSKEFLGTRSISCNIGTYSADPSDGRLMVTFNGKKYRYNKDVLRINNILAGKWQLEFSILSSSDQGSPAVPRVDSFVTNPNGAGPQTMIRSNMGILDFSSPKWQGINVVNILVYWSERQN